MHVNILNLNDTFLKNRKSLHLELLGVSGPNSNTGLPRAGANTYSTM